MLISTSAESTVEQVGHCLAKITAAIGLKIQDKNATAISHAEHPFDQIDAARLSPTWRILLAGGMIPALVKLNSAADWRNDDISQLKRPPARARTVAFFRAFLIV